MKYLTEFIIVKEINGKLLLLDSEKINELAIKRNLSVGEAFDVMQFCETIQEEIRQKVEYLFRIKGMEIAFEAAKEERYIRQQLVLLVAMKEHFLKSLYKQTSDIACVV